MKSFISYLGGKSRLSESIISRFPEHTCYCEVFAGAAWILFKKEESDVEIVNDINMELITLYRVIKNHIDEFIRYFRWALVSRDEFERLKLEKPETLTDIQRAARFYYLLKNGFASRTHNPSFSINTVHRSKMNLLRIEENLSAAHLRLAGVYIENLPYEAFIRRFDKPHTLFYIDPPYYNHENDYGKGIFKKEDFNNLADILKSVKGKFIMSINDMKEIREMFGKFYIDKVQTVYTCAKTKRKKLTELLISNFKTKKG